ncbi:hypothetical protein [Dietzia maris]|uniref:hypothetical protein n=1 Tax=Dietzia maris TaxID=37915 RepID=UPI00142D5433
MLFIEETGGRRTMFDLAGLPVADPIRHARGDPARLLVGTTKSGRSRASPRCECGGESRSASTPPWMS